MSKTITATHLARNLSDILNRVQYQNEEFVIQKNGKTIAKILSPNTERTTTAKEFADAMKGHKWPDPDFADDLEEIQQNQPPMQVTDWPS